MTGLELVTAQLKLIGAIAPDESISAAEAVDGLAVNNRMLSSWSTEGLMIYATVREEFSLVSGTQSYALGSGATFDTSRPVRIDRATIEIQSTSPVTETPLEIITVREWAEIANKDLTSDIPTHLYPEGTYPNETLNLWPKPSATNKIVLYSWKPLTQIASISTSISMPNGYEEALVYNGALRLAPEYGKTLTPEIVGIAGESKANIKRLNHRPRYLKVDPALMFNRSGFNINTGDFE